MAWAVIDAADDDPNWVGTHWSQHKATQWLGYQLLAATDTNDPQPLHPESLAHYRTQWEQQP